MEIKVMHQVMEWNEDVSDAVKAELAEHQVCLINVMGSPGAGKTSMIVSLINRLRETYRIGVIEGDIAGFPNHTLEEAMAACDYAVITLTHDKFKEHKDLIATKPYYDCVGLMR